jgi:hypothetical protein
VSSLLFAILNPSQAFRRAAQDAAIVYLQGKLNEAYNLQNRSAEEHELRLQANQSLTTLANSLFTGKVSLVVEPVLEAALIANFHGPVIKLDYLTSDHWAWSPIVNKVVGIGETSLNNFIVDMAGSYVLISVQNGSYSGHHLIYIW